MATFTILRLLRWLLQVPCPRYALTDPLERRRKTFSTPKVSEHDCHRRAPHSVKYLMSTASSTVAVLVAAGIGITPFASVLKNIWYVPLFATFESASTRGPRSLSAEC